MNTKQNSRFLGLIILILFGLMSTDVNAQVPDEIILSMKSGNAKTLSEYFNQNVELVVLENDNVYSRAQAQQIVSNFFQKHQPEDFSIIHQGGKQGAKYMIGDLVTTKGKFRVSFLLKQNGGSVYIHQLRIEK